MSEATNNDTRAVAPMTSAANTCMDEDVICLAARLISAATEFESLLTPFVHMAAKFEYPPSVEARSNELVAMQDEYIERLCAARASSREELAAKARAALTRQDTPEIAFSLARDLLEG